MCIPLAAAVVGAAVLGAGVSLYQGAKQRKQAKNAQAQNVALADQQAQRAETQFNRLNQKQPGIAALFERNRQGASRGLGSTFLTSPSGIPDLSKYLGGAPSVLGA